MQRDSVPEDSLSAYRRTDTVQRTLAGIPLVSSQREPEPRTAKGRRDGGCIDSRPYLNGAHGPANLRTRK